MTTYETEKRLLETRHWKNMVEKVKPDLVSIMYSLMRMFLFWKCYFFTIIYGPIFISNCLYIMLSSATLSG